MEAVILGKLVIVSSGWIGEEIVRKYSLGLVFHDCDSFDLNRKIHYLLKNFTDLQHKYSEGRNRFIKENGTTKYVKDILEKLKEVGLYA